MSQDIYTVKVYFFEKEFQTMISFGVVIGITVYISHLGIIVNLIILILSVRYVEHERYLSIRYTLKDLNFFSTFVVR